MEYISGFWLVYLDVFFCMCVFLFLFFQIFRWYTSIKIQKGWKYLISIQANTDDNQLSNAKLTNIG